MLEAVSRLADGRLSFVWTSVAILATLIYFVRKWQRYRTVEAFRRLHGCQDPPLYPHQDRRWGSDLTHLRMKAMKDGGFWQLYNSQFKTHGKTFEENSRGKKHINTIEPLNVQQVLALSASDYCKAQERGMTQGPFLGPSIFSEGETWKRSRALIKPAFAHAELSDMDHLSSFVDRFMETIPADGTTIDIQPMLHRLLVDVQTDFLFGRSTNTLGPQASSEGLEFVEAFGRAQKWFTKRRESGWARYYYDYFNKEWRESYKTVHRFVDEQCERALAEFAAEKTDQDAQPQRKRYVMLDEMAKQIRDPIALRYQILAVFIPARDTSSILVGNALFELARHPNLWAELRQTSLSLSEAPLTFEKLKSLKDFRNIVLETIRLLGPAARVWRTAVHDTTIPLGGGSDQKSPVYIPKGATVVMGTWAMNHDPDLWGDDVYEFKPERWIGRSSKWEFVPFGGGPRICPAQQQVMTYATYLLVRLTQRFEVIGNRDPVREYIDKFNFAFESRNGVKIAFR